MASEVNFKPLGAFAKVRSGFAFKSEDMGAFGFPIIKIKNVIPPSVDITDCERVPDEVIASIPRVDRYELKEGDILIAMTGATVGKVGRFPRTPERYFLNQRVGKVYLSDPKAADYRYIYYILSQDTYVRQIFGIADGSAQANISGPQIEKLEIPFPPLAIQKSIAHILGTLDDKIELNRRMNATLEQMARALFKSWFVDFDPVRAKMDGKQPAGMDAETAALFPDALEESELGLVPRGWELSQLAKLCQLGRGASPRPINDFMGGDVPWIKIADATAAGGPFLFETKEYVKAAGAEKSVPVAPGDLILSNSATCGVPIFVELNGCIHDGWLYFKNLRKVSKLFLFHFLVELAEHLIHIADGSVQKNLNTNLVGQQMIIVPPPEVVDVFDVQVGGLFGMMRQNGKQIRALAALRDTLLPKLLSGEVSVADAENEVVHA